MKKAGVFTSAFRLLLSAIRSGGCALLAFEIFERYLAEDASNGMTFEDRVINVFYHQTAEALADR